jgi:hypothetical protein
MRYIRKFSGHASYVSAGALLTGIVLSCPNISTTKKFSGMKRNTKCIRRAQVKVGLINLCKGLFSLNARIYYSRHRNNW